MSTTQYVISYDGDEILGISVDESEESKAAIKVEFRGGWEHRLQNNHGDYTQTWLKELALYFLGNRKVPKDEEGRYPMDGSKGIFLQWAETPSPDEDLIQIGIEA